MNAHLIVLILALGSQLGGRYDNAVTGDAADPAANTITLPADTPAPTLVDEPAADASTADDPAAVAPATDDTAAAAAAFAEPPAGSTPSDASPSDASPSDAPPADAAAAAAAQTPPAEAPESSVLVGGPRPAELMQQLVTTPQTGQLPGVALPLGDAMRGAVDRQAQTDRVEAYWDLSAAVTQYYLALQESQELAALRQGVSQPAAQAWDAAAADLAQRVDATRQSATAAQLRLHGLMGAAAGVSLPLPADMPHCGRYNTRYDEIFVTQMDPAARQLNELIPLLQAELTAEARQVDDASKWLAYVSEVREAANDGVGLLRSYELMAMHRREFVESARQYNCQIAAYSELAAPEQVEPQRLVSMLIRVSNPSAGAVGAAAGGASDVERASATEPVDAAPDSAAPEEDDAAKNDAGRTRTFWRPFQRLRDREHSILIHPLRLLSRNRE